MSEREELARIVLSMDRMSVIDAILAAGYRKPRTITTAEELDALPSGSVIRSDEGSVFEKEQAWNEAGSRNVMHARDIALPATVLDEPAPL